MTRTLRYLLLFVFTCLSGSVFAQGEIAGTVVDEKKEPIINAYIQVYQGGQLKAGVITDYDGKYSAKPLESGSYDVYAFYTNFDTAIVKKVLVTSGQTTTINLNMKRSGDKVLTEVTIYAIPLVNPNGGGVHTMTKDDIAKVATTDIKDVAALAPAVYQQKRGATANIGGARTEGTLYIIDGVQVQGSIGVGMAQNGVEQLEVMTSGIPAKYGDVSGGVISMTSRSVAQNMTGNVRLQHSIDGYNNNLASFSVAGPVYRKKLANGSKKSVLGFSMSGDYYDDHNRYPAYDKQYVIKKSELDRILANPLRISSDNTGNKTYNYESFYTRTSDLNQVKQVPDNRTQEARANGKLDFQATDNMRLIAGGNFDYTKYDKYDQWGRQRSLFNYDATPTQKDLTARGYIRFTQKFGKANDTSSRNSKVSNAFYSVQADYQRLSQNVEDPKFGKNIFNYGYVGEFHPSRVDVYLPGQQDSAATAALGRDVTGTIRLLNPITGITFDRGYKGDVLNPTLANYTTQYYGSLGDADLPTSIGEIQGNALANGDQPRSTYSAGGIGMFFSPGATQNYYTNYKSDQYALSVDASFDLQLGNSKHAIEFGLYYQQRIIRSFTSISNQGSINGGTNSLWALMRGLVSAPGENLIYDKSNPIYRVGGKDYTLEDIKNQVVIFGPADTILYNYKNIGTSTFDKNLRKKLGAKDNDIINVDELDPSKLSLDMFSADELLNLSGNSYVDYYGYSYTGAAQTGTVNFNDFFTQKDANGNFTRPIGAFSPNYIAGYLLDRFNYKDMAFNVGLRVDRYSANTKVLVDPYSLYEVKHVNQVAGTTNIANGGKHPGNVTGDYVVYVNDNNSTTPTIVGYRDGNNWYDPNGTLIEDPAVLKQYTNGRDPQPYLVKDNGKLTTMSDSTFNPNRSFTDYNPQVTLQPRLQFTFPISDVANFYAHYDIYAQRPYPTDYGNATAWDYFKLSQVAPTNEISNANLRPSKTFDYEVGFQQKLNSHSALTITGFYKERKNMVALQRYVNAYPYSYITFGNRDFSTTKGSTLLYDMRATNNFSMNVSYTLQFAEGSGSTPTSGRGFLSSIIQEGLPNLRYLTALNYDSRHIINARFDYRYGDGEGPTIKGRKVFQNAGANFIVRTRSGEPYTRYADAVGSTVIGGVNGSRLPWHFNTDLRIDKDFALSFGKRVKDAPEGTKPRRTKYVKGVVMINNLFNTREILGVYGYTGKPDDNGYLSSAFGQQFVPQQIDPQSYTDLYKIYMNDPNRYNYARTINLSLEFNF
jgi:hypothetical protein